jgi:hypothetical protein
MRCVPRGVSMLSCDAPCVEVLTFCATCIHCALAQPGLARAWKSFSWDAMDRLHEKGLIGDPASRAKSVILTDDGLKRSEALFYELFGKRRPAA